MGAFCHILLFAKNYSINKFSKCSFNFFAGLKKKKWNRISEQKNGKGKNRKIRAMFPEASSEKNDTNPQIATPIKNKWAGLVRKPSELRERKTHDISENPHFSLIFAFTIGTYPFRPYPCFEYCERFHILSTIRKPFLVILPRYVWLSVATKAITLLCISSFVRVVFILNFSKRNSLCINLHTSIFSFLIQILQFHFIAQNLPRQDISFFFLTADNFFLVRDKKRLYAIVQICTPGRTLMVILQCSA